MKGVAQAMSMMNATNAKLEARIDSFESAQSDQANAIADQRNLLIKTRLAGHDAVACRGFKAPPSKP